MNNLRPVRGTHDILPQDFRNQKFVSDLACKISLLYGFEEMTPPVFEFTEVFDRTLGETSDVVTKEMYSFEDRGGDKITLRPEFTAGIARAFISNGLTQQVPVKFFCRGPVFRHERPQKGRLRQFHQLNVENIGTAVPLADIELVALGAHVLEALGVLSKVQLKVNTLGDAESRIAYREKLLEYLTPFQNDLSTDSQKRLKVNPLRILDSKDEKDREIIVNAPILSDHQNKESHEFFEEVCRGLEALDISFEIDPRLVRGLDYYTHTAFEFVTSNLGAQGAVLAGGRYDGLISRMGGGKIPGIGWAAGIERLAIMRAAILRSQKPIAVIPVNNDLVAQALEVTQRLRLAGIPVDLGYTGNLGKRMSRANKLDCSISVIVGADELVRSAVSVRDMETGEQREVPIAELEKHLAQNC